MLSCAEARYSTGASFVIQRSMQKTNITTRRCVDTDTTSCDEVVSVKDAMDDLINVLQQSSNRFGRKTFVQILCDDFKRDMKAVDHAHMKNFAIIIPALCLNWLEAVLRGKEMMQKQNLTNDVHFVDDGFALGIAFILFVCGQDTSFDALNWFASVKHKQAIDEKSLREIKAAQEEKNRTAQASQQGSLFTFARAGKEEKTATEDRDSDEDEVRVALSMSWKMFESRKREMKTLSCTLHCSRALLLTSRIE